MSRAMRMIFRIGTTRFWGQFQSAEVPPENCLYGFVRPDSELPKGKVWPLEQSCQGWAHSTSRGLIKEGGGAKKGVFDLCHIHLLLGYGGCALETGDRGGQISEN